MTKSLFVKPAPGRRVRDPADGSVLPDEGREVTGNPLFWKQRLAFGDVVTVDDSAATKASRTRAKEI